MQEEDDIQKSVFSGLEEHKCSENVPAVCLLKKVAMPFITKITLT